MLNCTDVTIELPSFDFVLRDQSPRTQIEYDPSSHRDYFSLPFAAGTHDTGNRHLLIRVRTQSATA